MSELHEQIEVVDGEEEEWNQTYEKMNKWLQELQKALGA